MGADPNNWLEFGTIDGVTILWRIIKSNNEGIKIIYEGKRKSDDTEPDDNGKIGDKAWDTSNSNKWEKPNNKFASLKGVLDNWYETLSDVSQYIAPIHWCIGAVSGDFDPVYNIFLVTSLDTFLNNECADNYNLDGFKDKTSSPTGIGLIRSSNYISTSADTSCTGAGNEACKNHNFLYKSVYTYWTLNAVAGSSESPVWSVWPKGSLSFNVYASVAFGVRPVLNLKPGIFYDDGDGTLPNPYKVK